MDPDDEWGVAVIAMVGRQLKLRREAAGMRAGEFGKAIGYGEDLVYKVEGGKRIPQPGYLDNADRVLRAGGLISAMKEDVAKVRYPKKVPDLAASEAKAVELLSYGSHALHRLLQTEEFARALLMTRRPVPSPDQLEQAVAAHGQKGDLRAFTCPGTQLRPGRDDAPAPNRRQNGAPQPA